MRFFLSLLLYIFISIAIFTMTGPGEITQNDKKEPKMNILHVNRLYWLCGGWYILSWFSVPLDLLQTKKVEEKKNTKISCICIWERICSDETTPRINEIIIICKCESSAHGTLYTPFRIRVRGVNNNQKWRCCFFSFFSAMHLIKKWMFGLWVSIFEIFW